MTEKEIYDHLTANKMLVFYSVRGSFLYGTNVETSDIDNHGVFMHRNKEMLSLRELEPDFHDEKGDSVVFEMRKYLQMAMKANPTVLEMMFTPPEFIKVRTPISDLLMKNRDAFVTKACYYSFSGYAFDQIKKASGKNKKVHGKERYFSVSGIEKIRSLLEKDLVSPEWVELRFSKHFLKFILKGNPAPSTSETSFKKMDEVLADEEIKSLLPPRHLDFCYFVNSLQNDFPMRPIPINGLPWLDLKEYNCSSMEHVGGVYRLYYYGDKANGVFKGGEVVCSSIPMEDEARKFSGVMIYAHNEYESSKKDWKSYWEWMAERNENRWKATESEEAFEYDRKNMQHTVRLLLSGENVAKEGVPLIRFSGDKLKFLREIREGKYAYDYLMKFANDKVHELHSLFEKSPLPDGCDTKRVFDMYDEIVEMNG